MSSSASTASPDTSSGSDALVPDEIITDQKAAKRLDLKWAVSLFGTAVGAGILFLPINAGIGGPWPLIIVTLLIGPMTYLSHRALARFVCVSPRKGEDITVVAADYFGSAVGKGITLLYFCAIYPIVLIYGVGITNTVDSLLVNQFGLPQIPRALLSFVLIGLMMLVMIFGEKLMLAVSNLMVYPLIIILFILSLYLIPSWDFSGFSQMPTLGSFLMNIWLVIPVLIFAFNHSPAISQFSLAMQRAHGDKAADHASWTLQRTAGMLVIFTMFFVWSCSLALGPDGMIAAREANLPVLSHLANVRHEAFISYMGPLIATLAIGTSFFGHYLGAAEGAAGIVRSVAPSAGKKGVNIGVAVFIFLTTWLAAILNPSILSLIESLGGPVIAAILYIMPMVAIYKVPALAAYRKNTVANVFVIIAGTAAIAGILFGLAGLLFG